MLMIAYLETDDPILTNGANVRALKNLGPNGWGQNIFSFC